MRKGLVITLILSFMGLSWASWKAIAATDDRYLNLQIFAKVLNIVQQYYVEPVDSQKLIYGGIKGMLRELDPHTNFLPPDIYKEFESETTGEFGGIGIEISVEDSILTIISPIEDTPAWKAGIQPGDKIVEIDGTSTKGMSLVEAAQKMKGKNGTKIKLGIMRDSFEEPKTFAIIRDVVKIKSVKFVDMGEGYGYLRLTSFIENSASEMRKRLSDFKSKNKAGIKGIIFDLRRNPGGLLEQAVQISDLFLDKGIIVSTIGRDKNKKEVTMAKDDKINYSGFPIIVLINEYSASASEIVAGALKDNKRALVMGKRSFGKGSVQSVVKMGDGSGLKLTVARYYTPSGISIQAEGITPDVEVDEVDGESFEKAVVNKGNVKREADIQGHLIGDAEKEKFKQGKSSEWWKKFDSKGKSEKAELLAKDYQLLQAYNYIKAWKVFKSL